MYRAFFFTTYLLLFLLLVSPEVGAGTESEGLISRIKYRAAEVETFCCDFRQEKHLALFSRTMVFTGRLMVDRPDKLRWEFTSPLPSILIFNGRKGLKCSPEAGRQKFSLDSDPTMALLARQLQSWLSGDYSRLQDRFNIEELRSPPRLALTPVNKQSANMFEEILIQFDPVLLHPASITIRESGGDRTLLSFTNYQLNTALPNSLFTDCGEITGDDDSK